MLLSYLLYEIKIMFRKKLTLMLSIIFPVFFYILFTSILDLPKAVQQHFYKDYMYSMTVYSLISFSLMTFPLDLIEEQNNGWYKKLMSTTFNSFNYYTAKMIKTTILYLLAIVILFLVAHFYKDVNMTMAKWLLSGFLLWLGGSSFLSLGLIFAQFKDSQKVNAISNILTIGLAVLGGLWFPINTFPQWLQHIGKSLPSYHLKQLGISVTNNEGFQFQSFAILILNSVIFIMITYFINKRKSVV
ncbi:ABC transporter permease [Staphylococcus simiae]|uniref:ABC transporter permease n=1 Tax=Staphylococcus simiae TaxID=308354 RepID=UPI001A960F22|nr:ABC transporter permease [Staphylococcus simiae]MBO1199944.1 ABC transporter permease [Staphylococcus simiae]MBO1202203.1 ABC transporter permease [Staphylococcus simiae]MBO1204461.1 ABC transporter permease [Staphylococcus simiae]MBO1212001.1 ABC transporter permease [Staphylococcus simiae]MBO1230649.1 ABC transporter permease [Staphylococcus simiae]